MIIDFLLLFCLGVFAISNVIAPFCFALAYVWVDTFYPQYVSYNILSHAPVSMIFGVLMLMFYLLADRKIMPKTTGLLTLYGLMAICISLTTLNAVVPASAEIKYNASITVLLVASFLPFVINTRIRIEAVLMVMLFASSAHILPWGLKTILSGGGYQKSLGLVGTNGIPLSESSMMADFVFFAIPMFLYLAQHNVVLSLSPKPRRYLFWGLSLIFAVGAFGSFARTGLVTMGVVLVGYFFRAKRKLLFLPLVAVLAGGLLVASSGWKDRMETITDYQNEGSAETRLVVWKWAWEFAQQHPLGGGFDTYLVQDIITSQLGEDGQPIHVVHRAFHSIYFSILAEHGYAGILIFLSIIAGSFIALHRTRKQTMDRQDLLWAHDLAGHLQIGLAAMLAGDAFIDPSFYPILWYPMALALCLRSVVVRALGEPAPQLVEPQLQPEEALFSPMV